MKKYFKDMPPEFTKNYYFEFEDGRVTLSKLANLKSPEEDTEELDLVKNRDTGATQAIVKELCELTDEATGADIVNAELRLQQLPKIKMNPKKIESLQKKYDSIPPVYLPSYPGREKYLEKKRMRKDDDYELPVKKKKKRGPGRPKRVEKIEKNTIDKYLVAPFGARLLRKCSDEGDGERKGAGPNQASCPTPVPRRYPSRQAGKGIDKKIKV